MLQTAQYRYYVLISFPSLFPQTIITWLCAVVCTCTVHNKHTGRRLCLGCSGAVRGGLSGLSPGQLLSSPAAAAFVGPTCSSHSVSGTRGRRRKRSRGWWPEGSWREGQAGRTVVYHIPFNRECGWEEKVKWGSLLLTFLLNLSGKNTLT